MNGALSFQVIDDDPDFVEIVSHLIRQGGHSVHASASSGHALEDAVQRKPDCILLDIMMPGIDGITILRQLSEMEELSATTIVMVSAKPYDFDQRHALGLGAAGYITKPIDPAVFLNDLLALIRDEVVLQFWGVRGTLPVPGESSLKYGGNTSCVTLSFADGRFFVFDAGSGIKRLSDSLLAEGRTRLDAKIFISHPHWDHINALPFFVPLYLHGCEFEICGPSHGDLTMRELLSAQMDNVYFPITTREFAANVYFRNLQEGTHTIGGIEVQSMLLSHPGSCLGYRVNHGGRSWCYITDNELFLPTDARHNKHYVSNLTEFVRDADVLITDCTYFDDEYVTKVGWGHSCVGQVTQLAHDAGVRTLYLFHHDPDQTDDDIDRKTVTVQKALAALDSPTQCVGPTEGSSFTL